MRNLNTESLLLSEKFFEQVKGFEKNEEGKYSATDGYKKSILDNAYQLLAAGYSYESLSAVFQQATKEDRQSYNINEYIKKKEPDLKPGQPVIEQQVKGNCISIGTFYYHPMLQVTSKPPAYVLDSETMNMVKEEPEEFFLEMKEVFTLDELIAYFIYKTEQETGFPERFRSQLKRLVEEYGLDLTLYLIDAGVLTCRDDERSIPKAPMFFTEFITEARNMYSIRKDIAQEGGLTHVHPRKRRTP